ncbi:hypothetical protein PIB30_099634, partial [Stylosanthes scabra]|nr:hypothetical protein [Stylosanthes scabra]
LLFLLKLLNQRTLAVAVGRRGGCRRCQPVECHHNDYISSLPLPSQGLPFLPSPSTPRWLFSPVIGCHSRRHLFTIT